MPKTTNTKNYKPMFDRIKAEAEATDAETEGRASRTNAMGDTYKKGGKVSASSRADGCATKGKTKGKQVVMPGGKGMCGGGMTKGKK